MAKTRIRIPAGATPRPCKDREVCGAMIYFAPHPGHGRLHPVSVADAECQAPTAEEDGFGYSHFLDCPAAMKFKRPMSEQARDAERGRK